MVGCGLVAFFLVCVQSSSFGLTSLCFLQSWMRWCLALLCSVCFRRIPSEEIGRVVGVCSADSIACSAVSRAAASRPRWQDFAWRNAGWVGVDGVDCRIGVLLVLSYVSSSALG